MNLNYYGGFRTNTFGEVFDSAESFIEAYNNCGIKPLLKEESVNLLFWLLYARYGNSHIANSIDQNQFVYSLFSIVFMYGPTWEKKLEIQEKLRAMDDDQITLGGKAIYNSAFNPGTAPSTATLEELTTINQQNTTNYKKSKLEGYSILLTLLETDVTEDFISKFSKLFLKIVAPDYPLLYETTLIPEDSEND